MIAQSIEDHRLILSALRAQDGAALAHALGVHEHRIYDTTRALLAASNKKETPCA